MQLSEKLAQSGEHPMFLKGLSGQLEAVLTVPEVIHTPYAAILGHPHSLQGGSMTNKVVTTLARMFKESGIPSLRFNFRGVGQSEGVYDAGVGESDDMLSVVREWQHVQPELQFIFAGFSFGSYVTYRAAAQHPHRLLISVAPAVHNYNYAEFNPAPYPWIILQGEEDEVVPPEQVYDFAAHQQPVIPVMHFAETTHFFHGKLIELKTRLAVYLAEQGISS